MTISLQMFVTSAFIFLNDIKIEFEQPFYFLDSNAIPAIYYALIDMVFSGF